MAPPNRDSASQTRRAPRKRSLDRSASAFDADSHTSDSHALPTSKRRRIGKPASMSSQSSASGAAPAEARLTEASARPSALPTPEPSNVSESQCLDAGPPQQPHEPLDPKAVFPFMKLPAELRVHIYRMALQRDEPLLLHLPRPAEKSEEENGRPRELGPRIRHTMPGAGESRPPHSDTSSTAMDPPRDNINPALLRTCSLIYKEARQVLYADNVFTLSLMSGIHTLSSLHQRSRSLIKSVSLTIPSHHDILDGFADLVRLGLRYCWGLKRFTIILQATFPDDRAMSGATSVYANAFHILRWLPQGCKVVLEGNVSEVVKKVVIEEGRLQEQLDETSYLKRQHQMPERH